MKRVHKGVEYDNDGEIKFGANSGNGLGQTRGQNFIFKVHIELSKITLSPATPKGANVGAVNVFVGSLQFVCQNGQVLIAVLMNS